MLVPLAFMNETVEDVIINQQKEAFRGMSSNDTFMSFLGISDWDNVFTLEGIITTYLFNLFVPLLIAIATIVCLNKMGAKAEEDGTFEFVASLPLSRKSIYYTHSFVSVVLGILLGFIWINLIYAPIAIFGTTQDMEYVPLLKASLQSSLGGVTFGVLGFSIASFSGNSSQAWTFGMGVLGIEWISNMFSSRNNFFKFIDSNLSSFGAYGNPYKEGLAFDDLLLVTVKIVLFLLIGYFGFTKRSLNLR